MMMAGALHLAGGQACKVPRAPQVVVTPVTKPVVYDFSRTVAELSAMKSDTVNPYGPGADTATGGLRFNETELRVSVRVGYEQRLPRGVCMWYDTVEVQVELAPRVYVAKEFGRGACHKEILAHEQRHVRVDREIINRYVQSMGDLVRQIVNASGAAGPFPQSEIPARQDRMVALIRDGILSQKAELEAYIRKRQAEVDTLEEYERVSAICHRERREGR